MFSSDVKAIRLAELKAAGHEGTIARLRSAIGDAAKVMDKAAAMVVSPGMAKDHKEALAEELRRAVVALRSLRTATKPPRKMKARK